MAIRRSDLVDTRIPSLARQAELEEAYERQKDSLAPYAGVTIQSLGELDWIMEKRSWSGEYRLPKGTTRANLRGIIIPGIIIRGALLHETNLSGASIIDSDLIGAHLEVTDLRGADLRESQMDQTTNLDKAIVNSRTKLGDIHWNGVPILHIDWSNLRHGHEMRLGDEYEIDKPISDGKVERPKTRNEKIHTIHDVVRAYQGLGRTLSEQHMRNEASQCRLRQIRLERKIHFLKRSPRSLIAGIGSWILDLVSGYGEIPSRIFIAYIGLIGLFSTINFVLTNTVQVSQTIARLTWDESLVLSLTSFHGRGFFPGYLQLNDWIARVGAVEAVIGLFIEIVFIATFTRRFLAD